MPSKTSPQHPETLAVSPTQAAKVIGLHPPTLEKDRRVGHLGIPFVKAGRRVIYRFADLKDWLEEHKQLPIKQGATQSQMITQPPTKLQRQPS